MLQQQYTVTWKCIAKDDDMGIYKMELVDSKKEEREKKEMKRQEFVYSKNRQYTKEKLERK